MSLVLPIPLCATLQGDERGSAARLVLSRRLWQLARGVVPCGCAQDALCWRTAATESSPIAVAPPLPAQTPPQTPLLRPRLLATVPPPASASAPAVPARRLHHPRRGLPRWPVRTHLHLSSALTAGVHCMTQMRRCGILQQLRRSARRLVQVTAAATAWCWPGTPTVVRGRAFCMALCARESPGTAAMHRDPCGMSRLVSLQVTDSRSCLVASAAAGTSCRTRMS